MSNPAMDVALFSFFLPPLFAIIIQWHWPTWAKQVVSFLLYLLVTVFVWAYRNHVDSVGWGWRDYIDAAWPVLAGGVVGYKALWSDTIKDGIEKATTLPPGAP